MSTESLFGSTYLLTYKNTHTLDFDKNLQIKDRACDMQRVARKNVPNSNYHYTHNENIVFNAIQ